MIGIVRYAMHLATLTLLLTGAAVRADNPLVPDVGMADPHILIFNDKAYLFSTRDAGGPESTRWNMPDWNIWSSEDLIQWQHERTILPTETYIGESIRCWAPDAATFNGKYYLYLSNGNKDTAVMVADDPAGPYLDALGEAMLPQGLTSTKEYDPSVLIEDGVPYLVFGLHTFATATKPATDYHIVQLNTNMISLAETPRPIEFVGDFPAGDKPDLTKHGDRFYLSVGANYAIADTIYGPYVGRPIVGDDSDPHGLNSRAHGKLFDWRNQSFFVWCRFINGEGNEFKYRESLMTYVHYKADGDIVYDRDFLDAHSATGVGQYSASWEAIEAEWFMSLSDGPEKTETQDGGFEISNLRNGDYLGFPHIHNCPKDPQVELSYSCAHAAGGTVSVRAGDETGPEIGTAEFAPTGSWTDYKTLSIPLNGGTAGETRSITFVFQGEAGQDLIHFDSFNIPQASAVIAAKANANLTIGSTWTGNAAPESGDVNVWQTGGYSIGLHNQDKNQTTNFLGGTLVVQSGGELNANAIGPTLVVNNLVLDGGTITIARNGAFIFDLSGKTFTLNSGTLKAGGSNESRDIRFFNGKLAGRGTIQIEAAGNAGSDVEFEDTMDMSSFGGVFDVQSGILNLPPVGSNDVSFGLMLSGTGVYTNDADVAVASLVIDGETIPPGFYGFSDFSTNRQAFIGDAGGTITVIDGYGVWAARNGITGGKTGDANGDGRSNIYAFGLGDHQPISGMTSNGLEFVHARRSAAYSGVHYSLAIATNLTTGGWVTNGIEFVGYGSLDDEFDAVTNRISTLTENEQFIRLLISPE